MHHQPLTKAVEKTLAIERYSQVSLYIAEHRAELEAEGGKDKAQVICKFLCLSALMIFPLFILTLTGDWLGSLEGP